MKLNGALQSLRDEARAAWEHFRTDQWRRPIPFESRLHRVKADLIKWGRTQGFDERNVDVVVAELVAESANAASATTNDKNRSHAKQPPPALAGTNQHSKRERPQVRTNNVTPKLKTGPTIRDVFQRAVGSRVGPESATTRLVLLRLAMYGNPDGTRIFPGIRRLAEDCGLNPSTVWQHLREAEKQRWIQRERRRYQDGSLGSYQYTLLVPTAKRRDA